MALDTDLSRAPYFNDYDSNSNHYAVLYRPGVPVQAREMNETQSILQDQIDKLGRHVFKEGSVVEGCAFSFNNRLAYVKIKDTYSNGTAFTISDLVGRNITNANGLKAVIIDAISGFESQNPDLNTLYLKYLNSTTYANGVNQMVFDTNESLSVYTSANVLIGNVTTSNVNFSVGYGYSMSVTEGVIFKKGYFIRVPTQSVIVTKYNRLPHLLSVGFQAEESIETPASNTQLYDNAQGAPNYGAPGAHRLKLMPTLVVRPTAEVANTATFFSICDFQNGKPVTIKNDPQYAVLGKELARRTFETNGDFVVNPFLLTAETKKANNLTSNTTSNTTHLNLVSSPGLAYAKGYRVEFTNKTAVNLRKGLDTERFTNRTSANFGYYIYANEFVGDFNIDTLAQVELHNDQYNAVSSGKLLNTTYDSANKIGTAYIRGIEYDNGIPGIDASYLIYLFNINIEPGYSFDQVRSIVYQQSSNIEAVADVILTYDYASNSNIAKLEESAINSMIFPLGQQAVVPNSFNNTSFVYRNRYDTGAFDTNGNMTVTISPAVNTGIETFTYGVGQLSPSQRETFIAIATADGIGVQKTGNVTVSNTTNIVIGNGTTFTSDYRVGDAIQVYANTTTADPEHNRVIASITNSTHLVLKSNFPTTLSGAKHRLIFPKGMPIALSRSDRSIDVTSATTANVSLGTSLGDTLDVAIYHDILRDQTSPIRKVVRRGTIVKIKAANNTTLNSGPWCLGLTDVFKLNSVWVSTNGSFSSSIVDSVSSFSLDTGQRDTYYDLAYLKTNLTTVPAGALIMVSVDHFTHDQSAGRGFFTANSYPIDDANGEANTEAITTAEIPLFTSPTTGNVYDLRDCVDFRPFVANTAVMTSNTTLATEDPNTAITFAGAVDSSIPGSGSLYSISPNQLFKTDVAHYLPRIDRVSVTTAGQLVLTEGKPSVTPIAPQEQSGTMTLGTINVPPYPTLSAVEAKIYDRYDYAPVINLSQIKRYTMADIGTLANRITNLEYYTSLTALEQSTASLLVRSGTTGQNRFKNGILVDPFKGHDIGNTLHPQYAIAIDDARQEARPFFRVWTQELYLDTALSTGYKKTGGKITLDFTPALFQQQPYASKYHNCVEGNVFNWIGNIFLYPSGDLEPDRTMAPDVVNNIDLSANWINVGNSAIQPGAQPNYPAEVMEAANTQANQVIPCILPGSNTVVYQSVNTAYSHSIYVNYHHYMKHSKRRKNRRGNKCWGTQWGHWCHESRHRHKHHHHGHTSDPAKPKLPTVSPPTPTSPTSPPGTTPPTPVSNTSINLGTFVTDINISPYVRPRQVFFYATGMKPGARVYPYFASTRVSDYCKQLYEYTGEPVVTPDATPQYRAQDGEPLYVFNSSGVYIAKLSLYSAKNPGTNTLNAWGNPLKVESDGTIKGVFSIPEATFKTGDVQFRLVDIADLSQGESAISTDASVIYAAFSMSVSYGKSVLNTRYHYAPPPPPLQPPPPPPTPSPYYPPHATPPPPVYVDDCGPYHDPGSVTIIDPGPPQPDPLPGSGYIPDPPLTPNTSPVTVPESGYATWTLQDYINAFGPIEPPKAEDPVQPLPVDIPPLTTPEPQWSPSTPVVTEPQPYDYLWGDGGF